MKHETIGAVSLLVTQANGEGHPCVPVTALTLTPNQEKLFEILDAEGVISEKSIRAKLNLSSAALHRMKDAINLCGEIIRTRKTAGFYIAVPGLRPDHEGLYETFDRDVPLTPREAEVHQVILRRPGISLANLSEATGQAQGSLTGRILPTLRMRGRIAREGYFPKDSGE